MDRELKFEKMKKDNRYLAIEAIRKKLIGKKLSYREVFSLMDEIAHKRLGPILTTYFIAASFKEGFSPEELYHLTKAMVETGKRLKFKGMVADKHSTGGVPGTRTTMILVPIIASAGIKIPKNSSRAITSPSGTADTMEVLAPVTFTPAQTKKIVEKAGGCIVWGGHLGLAPADDMIIQVEEPLAFESFDKIIISIMAKKVAVDATHLVLDIPVGPTVKIRHFKDAETIAKKFKYLGKKFKIKISVDINHTLEPAGRGIGPTLEVKDVLQVLEQKKQRPLSLEQKALRLSGKLLDLCFADMKQKKGLSGEEVAKEILTSGQALAKLREIVVAQGGNSHFESGQLKAGKYKWAAKAPKKGEVVSIDSHQITVICRILGTPDDKKAGIYLERKIDEKVDKNDILFIMYAQNKWKLEEAKETLKNVPIFKIE